MMSDEWRGHHIPLQGRSTLLSFITHQSSFIISLENTRRRHLDALESHLELFGVGGKLEGGRTVNVAAFDQLTQVLREVHHAFEIADADGVGKLEVFALRDQLSDCRIDNHDLVGGNTSLFQALEELLTDDGLEVIRQGLADGA